MRFRIRVVVLLIAAVAAFPHPVVAQDGSRGFEIRLGDEYVDYRKERKGPAASRKRTPTRTSAKSENLFVTTLLYLPRRVMDFLDIFRIDVGVGKSAGVVVRMSSAVQGGYRGFFPASYRLGLRGRNAPWWTERKSEYGLSPWFTNSPQRKPTSLEIGAGADLGFAGIYLGLSLDECGDFFAGIIGYDPKDDD